MEKSENPTLDVSAAETLVRELHERSLTIAAAESCTGGMIAAMITSVPGASNVFHCGMVTYSNDMKEKMLGVKKETLVRFSAVSGETAAEMAKGARLFSGADIAVSVTGNAGPEPSEGKPVGEVWIAVSSAWEEKAVCFHFPALSRNAFREKAAQQAIEMAVSCMENKTAQD